MVVGLILVRQLSLSVHFSGFIGITEVYNLLNVGNPDDHKYIPGNEKAGVSNHGTGGIFSQQWSIKLEKDPILDHWYSEVRDCGI